jgi:hypothetical protein
MYGCEHQLAALSEVRMSAGRLDGPNENQTSVKLIFKDSDEEIPEK